MACTCSFENRSHKELCIKSLQSQTNTEETVQFLFFHSVFKGLVLQTHDNQSLFEELKSRLIFIKKSSY